MGRKTVFDCTEELSSSLHLFCSRGYRAVFLRRLEDTNELNAGNLYYYFKNKDNLYIQLIDFYLKNYLQHRIACYLGKNTILMIVENCLLQVIETQNQRVSVIVVFSRL